jgi:hypothetical protein
MHCWKQIYIAYSVSPIYLFSAISIVANAGAASGTISSARNSIDFGLVGDYSFGRPRTRVSVWGQAPACGHARVLYYAKPRFICLDVRAPAAACRWSAMPADYENRLDRFETEWGMGPTLHLGVVPEEDKGAKLAELKWSNGLREDDPLEVTVHEIVSVERPLIATKAFHSSPAPALIVPAARPPSALVP